MLDTIFPLGMLVRSTKASPVMPDTVFIIIAVWPSPTLESQHLYKLLAPDATTTFLLHNEIIPA
jgi:hypothetical protein